LLEGIAARIEEEHRRLFSNLSLEADMRLDDELDAFAAQAGGDSFHSPSTARLRSAGPERRRHRPLVRRWPASSGRMRSDLVAISRKSTRIIERPSGSQSSLP
jgi:hypothetical protein